MNFPLRTSAPAFVEAETGSFSLTDVVCSESTKMSAVTRIVSLTANPVLGSRTMLDCAKSHQPCDFLLAENLHAISRLIFTPLKHCIPYCVLEVKSEASTLQIHNKIWAESYILSHPKIQDLGMQVSTVVVGNLQGWEVDLCQESLATSLVLSFWFATHSL